MAGNYPTSIFNIGSSGGTKTVECVTPMWYGFSIKPESGKAPIVEYLGKRIRVNGPDNDGDYSVSHRPTSNNTEYVVKYVPKTTNVTVTSNGGKAIGVHTYQADGTEIYNTLDASGGTITQTYNYVSNWADLILLDIDYDYDEYSVTATYTDQAGNSGSLAFKQGRDDKKIFYLEYAKAANVKVNVEFTEKSKTRKFNFVNFGEGVVSLTGMRNGSTATGSYKGYWTSMPSFDYESNITIEVTPPEGQVVKSISARPMIYKVDWNTDETTGKVTVSNWKLPREVGEKENFLNIKYAPKTIADGTHFAVHLSVEGDKGSTNYVNCADADWSSWFDDEDEDNMQPGELMPGESADIRGVYNSDETQQMDFFILADNADEGGFKTVVEVYVDGELFEPTAYGDGYHCVIPLDGSNTEVRVVYSSNGLALTGSNGEGGTIAIFNQEDDSTPVATVPSNGYLWVELLKDANYRALITPQPGKTVTAILLNGELLDPAKYRLSDGTFSMELKELADGISRYQLNVIYGDGDVTPWITYCHEGSQGSLYNLLTTMPGNQRRALAKFSMKGRLNGRDMIAIRRLAGADDAYNKPATDGLLHYLDLTDAVIVNEYSFYDASDGTSCYLTYQTLPKYMLIDTKIDTLVLPQKLTDIESLAFTGAVQDMTVIAPWAEPLALETDPFGTDVAGMTLVVPRGSKARYEENEMWSKFGTIKEAELSEPFNVTLQMTGAQSYEDYAELMVGNAYGFSTRVDHPSHQREVDPSLFNASRDITIKVYVANGKSVKLSFNGTDYTSLLVNKGVQADSSFPNSTLYEYVGTDCDQFFAEGTWIVSLDENIDFADEAVKAICLEHWDFDGNGELSKAEAAMVTTLRVLNADKTVYASPFKSNTNITSFDELQYFTGLNEIADSAFFGCSNLASVIVPEKVVRVRDRAFQGCSKLTSVVMPEGLSIIYTYSFMNCSSLEDVTLPNSVKSIFYGAFYNCTNLKYFKLPNKLSYVESMLFANTSVKSINIPSSLTTYNGIPLPSTILAITVDPGNKYYDSRNLCNAVIRTSDNTLVQGCQNTKIPDDVTTIRENAFARVPLTTIEIPASVTTIHNWAFQYCSSLTSVVMKGETPPTIQARTFEDINATCVLTVPKGTRNAYIAAGWTEEIFKGGIVEAEDETTVVSSNLTWTLCAVGDVENGATVNISANSDTNSFIVDESSMVSTKQFDFEPDGLNVLFGYIHVPTGYTMKIWFEGEDYTDKFSKVGSSETTDLYQAIISAEYDAAAIVPLRKNGQWVVFFEKPGSTKGDINGDGMTTIADVTKLVNIILGKE